MTANITYKVDPLIGDNYIAWQRHLKWILDDQDLWDVTNGSELEPKPTNPRAITPAKQTTIDDWKKRDKKAKREISLQISDECLVYIDQVSTASELWMGLQRIFQSKAAISTIQSSHQHNPLAPRVFPNVCQGWCQYGGTHSETSGNIFTTQC